ncbi:MAG TPA: 2-phospho-L-lactate guanylyltransferase [Solirubrobacteraceae bacterium]|nr:2-phospho-L-lactate guanylyltransferase [Solirubrobacteraceae bacterium]
MTTVAVLPIKRFSHAKQRLERDDRGELMRTMASGVLDAVCGAVQVNRVLVVTSDLDAGVLARRAGAEVVHEPGLLGHSAAASLGVARAVELGALRVLLVAGDCPLMQSADVDALLTAFPVDAPGVVVLADRHGTGTNGLLLSPPAAIAPAFGPGSRERHAALAADAGVPCVVEERTVFAHDVDTLDDLAAIERTRAA